MEEMWTWALESGRRLQRESKKKSEGRRAADVGNIGGNIHRESKRNLDNQLFRSSSFQEGTSSLGVLSLKALFPFIGPTHQLLASCNGCKSSGWARNNPLPEVEWGSKEHALLKGPVLIFHISPSSADIPSTFKQPQYLMMLCYSARSDTVVPSPEACSYLPRNSHSALFIYSIVDSLVMKQPLNNSCTYK